MGAEDGQVDVADVNASADTDTDVRRRRWGAAEA